MSSGANAGNDSTGKQRRRALTSAAQRAVERARRRERRHDDEHARQRLERPGQLRVQEQDGSSEEDDAHDPQLDGEGERLAQKDPAGSSPRVATEARVPGEPSITWLRLIMSSVTSSITR